MSRTVVIVIEGVLQADDGLAPIPEGILLYHGLKSTFNIALVTQLTDYDKAKYWLDLNGFREHPYLIVTKPEDSPDPATRRLTQLNRLRQSGSAIDLLIEPDPAIAASVLKAGVAVLIYLHPRYSRPEYRPDYDGRFKPRAWDELMLETQRQEEIRAADNRLSENSL